MRCPYYHDSYCFYHGDTGEVCDKISWGTGKRIPDGYCPREMDDIRDEQIAEEMIKAEEENRKAVIERAMNLINSVFVTGKYPTDDPVQFATIILDGLRMQESESRSLRSQMQMVCEQNARLTKTVNRKRERLSYRMMTEFINEARKAVKDIPAKVDCTMYNGVNFLLGVVDSLLAAMLPEKPTGKKRR